MLVDVREPGEREEAGIIAGAVHVPRGVLEFCADPASPAHRAELNPERRVILHCASGGRSALAAVVLRDMGYRDVAHLDGGLAAWERAGMSDRPAVTGLSTREAASVGRSPWTPMR